VIVLIVIVTYQRFRRVVPEIRTQEDLRRLRSLAKLQMYLAQIGNPAWTMGGVFPVWLLGWLVLGELGWLDLLLLGIVLIIILFAFALIFTSPAQLSKTIPTSEELVAERDHVIDVSLNRKWPDW
jgi:hypothetical protein